MQKRTALFIFLLIALAVITRSLPLIRGPFIDTRAMAQTMVLRQMIANHGKVAVDSLSGVGVHKTGYAEINLIYLILIPYELTLGILGAIGTLYAVNLLFLVMTALIIYLLTFKLTGSTKAGLFALLLFALSQIGIYSEALNNWAGFSYIPSLLLLSLLLLLYGMKARGLRRLVLWLFSLIVIAFAYVLWDGGGYALTAYLFVALMCLLHRYLRSFRLVLGIGVALVAAAWFLLLFNGPLFNLLTPIQITAMQVAPGGNLKEIALSLVAEFEPLSYQGNGLYNALTAGLSSKAIPFILWAAASFLSTTLFALVYLWKSRRSREKDNPVFFVLVMLLLFSLPFAMENWPQFVYLPILILAGSLFSAIKPSKGLIIFVIYVLLVAFAFTLLQIETTIIYGGVSSQLESASLWLSNNTQGNATILTFQGDGTGVEYWAHRQSFLDTNIAGNESQIFAFSAFLGANAYNFSYLRGFKPNYLLLYDFELYNASATPFNQTNVYLFKGISPENITSASYNLTMDRVYSQNSIVIYRLSYQAKS